MKPTDLSLYNYITQHNPSGANQVLVNNGYKPSKNRTEIATSLQQLAMNKGDDALKEIAEVHPDRDLILSTVKGPSRDLNACGCRADGESCNCDKCRTKNAGGEEEKKADKKADEHTKSLQAATHQYNQMLMPVLLISAVILSVALIANKK